MKKEEKMILAVCVILLIGVSMILIAQFLQVLTSYGCAVIILGVVVGSFLFGRNTIFERLAPDRWSLSLMFLFLISIAGDATICLFLSGNVHGGYSISWFILVFPAFYLIGYLTKISSFRNSSSLCLI